MKNEGLWKRVLLVFVVALVGYIAIFSWIEHRRTVKGGWQVTFASENNAPVLIVNQPTLEIQNVRIVFPDKQLEPATDQTLEFSKPRAVPFDVPYGKCVFFDPLYLPGTVVFEMFGHRIQILPRVLTVDEVEHPWHSGETLTVSATTNRVNTHKTAEP